MQITDINRTLNLILVGILAIVINICLFWQSVFAQIHPYLSTIPIQQIIDIGPILVLIFTPVFLALSVFVGVIVEGFAELFIQEFIVDKIIYKSKILRRIFFLQWRYKLNSDLQRRYKELLTNSTIYHMKDANHDEYETFAAALFLQKSQPEHSKWVLHHYSIHILASEFTFLILYIILIAPLLSLIGVSIITPPLLLIIVLGLFIHPLIYIIVDREGYAYEAAYRYTILVLLEEVKPTDKNDNNPKIPPKRK